MAEHVYKKIEVTGTSNESIDLAIKNAISRASKSVHNMRWFEVTETRGAIDGGGVSQFQVTLKIGFALDD